MMNEKWWEDIAALFHATYERLAPSFGYKTREETAVPWDMVKENNRRLMTATVAEIMPAIVAEAERRGYERAMEEVKKASILTTSCVVAPGEEKEEWVDALCIPKSFFEKQYGHHVFIPHNFGRIRIHADSELQLVKPGAGLFQGHAMQMSSTAWKPSNDRQDNGRAYVPLPIWSEPFYRVDTSSNKRGTIEEDATLNR